MSEGLIVGQIVGSELVQAKLAQISLQRQKRVRMTVNALGGDVLKIAKDNYLSGGSLNTRSGRLRRSVNVKNTDDGSTFTSTVGTNLAYGRFWEKGFHGTEQVGEYTRRNSAQLQDAYRLRGLKSGMLGPRQRYLSSKHKGEGTIIVHAFTRKVDQEARPFLQPALADMKAEIRARLAGAMGGS